MLTDQWLCPCTWYNSFLRKKCRNCGEPKLPDEVIRPVFEVYMKQAIIDGGDLNQNDDDDKKKQ